MTISIEGQKIGNGRGTVGKCTGPKWSKRPFWSKWPYSELDFSIRKTKRTILVHFGLKSVRTQGSIALNLTAPTLKVRVLKFAEGFLPENALQGSWQDDCRGEALALVFCSMHSVQYNEVLREGGGNQDSSPPRRVEAKFPACDLKNACQILPHPPLPQLGRIPQREGLSCGRGGTSTTQQGSFGKRDDVKDASPQTLVCVCVCVCVFPSASYFMWCQFCAYHAYDLLYLTALVAQVCSSLARKCEA